MDDIVRVYVKGAPEFVINKCIRTFNVDGKKIPMNDDQLNYIISDITSKKFTTQGYRCLAFAYKDYQIAEFENLREQHGNFEAEATRSFSRKTLPSLECLPSRTT